MSAKRATRRTKRRQRNSTRQIRVLTQAVVIAFVLWGTVAVITAAIRDKPDLFMTVWTVIGSPLTGLVGWHLGRTETRREPGP